ncbi:hypothetical protein GQ457_03G023700 [Hibiscus cannabinus]
MDCNKPSMVTHVMKSPTTSYKDMLIRGIVNTPNDDLISLDDDDSDLLDEGVRIREMDGDHSLNEFEKKDKVGWMVIKVDLHKAFDSLCCDFNEDTLVDKVFSKSFINLIMYCVTSSTMQVQWNSDHFISLIVATDRCPAFHFTRQGIPISRLFFVDDLILYAKATMENASCIEAIFELFGHCSGCILEGLKVAWLHEFDNLIIQTDSSDVFVPPDISLHIFDSPPEVLMSTLH